MDAIPQPARPVELRAEDRESSKRYEQPGPRDKRYCEHATDDEESQPDDDAPGPDGVPKHGGAILASRPRVSKHTLSRRAVRA